MTRAGGNDNCGDLGTKHLDYQTMNRHLTSFVECVWRKARARLTGGSPHSATRRHDQRLELDTGNLVCLHSPNTQSCDLAGPATSQ